MARRQLEIAEQQNAIIGEQLATRGDLRPLVTARFDAEHQWIELSVLAENTGNKTGQQMRFGYKFVWEDGEFQPDPTEYSVVVLKVGQPAPKMF